MHGVDPEFSCSPLPGFSQLGWLFGSRHVVRHAATVTAGGEAVLDELGCARTGSQGAPVLLFGGIGRRIRPAVSFVKPSGYLDGHPASSNVNLPEGFVRKIVDLTQANSTLAFGLRATCTTTMSTRARCGIADLGARRGS